MKPKKRESGIALFMVVSAIALLAVLMAELTYSSQMNSRLAYNYVDNLKAYYMAKAGYKLSILRLKAYLQIKTFINNPNNKAMKEVLGSSTIEKVWNIPFIFPPPIGKDASMSEKDTLNDFLKQSKLSGTFTAAIAGESSKLNLNNLFVKEATAAQASSNSPTGAAASPTPTPTPTTKQQNEAVDFSQVLEPALTALIDQRKENDRDFADIYRNTTGKDVLDAIKAYLFADMPSSNLPGFRQIQPKQAPMYSLSELHLIPGMDDPLFDLLEPSLTVYSTAGINVNSISKKTLRALIPELVEQDADDVLRKRDDADVGKPWTDENDFWKSIEATSAGNKIETIKERFQKANIKLITEEHSFKIGVLANVGQSTRRLEAYVTLDAKAAKKDQPQASPAPGGQPQPGNTQSDEDQPSAKKSTGVNLIYWRMM